MGTCGVVAIRCAGVEVACRIVTCRNSVLYNVSHATSNFSLKRRRESHFTASRRPAQSDAETVTTTLSISQPSPSNAATSIHLPWDTHFREAQIPLTADARLCMSGHHFPLFISCVLPLPSHQRRKPHDFRHAHQSSMCFPL